MLEENDNSLGPLSLRFAVRLEASANDKKKQNQGTFSSLYKDVGHD